jgi:hypothetical protein
MKIAPEEQARILGAKGCQLTLDLPEEKLRWAIKIL